MEGHYQSQLGGEEPHIETMTEMPLDFSARTRNPLACVVERVACSQAFKNRAEHVKPPTKQ